MNETIEIRSRDYWVKVLDMLPQWALVDEDSDGGALGHVDGTGQVSIF